MNLPSLFDGAYANAGAFLSLKGASIDFGDLADGKVMPINDYSYLCNTRTRQASQRCSNKIKTTTCLFIGMWWFLYNPAFYGILEVEAEINTTLERIATLGEVFLVACGGIIYRKGIVMGIRQITSPETDEDLA